MKTLLKPNTIIKITVLYLAVAGLSSCVTPTEPETELLTELLPVPEETVIKEPKPNYMQVAERDAEIIGHKIWMNEGGAKEENLTVWRPDENFASLGIGHFIWYPAHQPGIYEETFPQLLAFLQQQPITFPEWLEGVSECPWNTRRAFYDDINSVKMGSLRNLLKETIPQQVQFILQRLEQALPKMLATLSTEEARTQVREQFYRVAQKPVGVYALVDYVHFKGEGISPTERYKNRGWGLLQVLENMSGDGPDSAMSEFVQAADRVLTRRVRNAPQDESHLLPGWRHRLKTYTYEW